MNVNGFDMEMMEAYLLNRLPKNEQLAFENRLRQDPLLQSEVNFQKEVLSSVQNFRKAQLKSRLDKIEVPSTPTFGPAKIAAVVVSGLLAGALFLFLQTTENTTDTEQEESIVQVQKTLSSEPKVLSPGNNTVEETVIAKGAEAAVSNEKNVREVQATADEIKPKSHKELEAEEDRVGSDVRVPDFSDNFNDTEGFDKHVSLPEGNLTQTVETKLRNLEVKVSEKEGVHEYQYYNNKLFLFGNFNSSPYEILELNAAKGKELFLYFNNEYYLLVPNTLEPSSLQELADPDVRRQLETMRMK